MTEFLVEARKKSPLALVGGSDLAKIVEQLGDSQEEGKPALHSCTRYISDDYGDQNQNIVTFKRDWRVELKKEQLLIVSCRVIPRVLGLLLFAVMSRFDYVFSENGLVAHKGGRLLAVKTIQDQIGDEKLQRFINFCLAYLGKTILPVKRYGSRFLLRRIHPRPNACRKHPKVGQQTRQDYKWDDSPQLRFCEQKVP